jgi:hypothetical protein
MSTRWPFESLVRDLIAILARGDYAEAERRTAGVRLSAAEIEAAVTEYGRRLEPAPEGGALPANVVPIQGSASPAWSVWTPLLQLTVWARQEGGFQAQIDGILVP